MIDNEKQGLTENLTLRGAQEAVDGWIGQWEEGYWSPLANLARLSEEVGELAREINHVHGAKRKKATEREGRIAEELADVLFVVITLANSMEIDLEEAFLQVLRKYGVRDAARWTARRVEELDTKQSDDSKSP